MNKSYLFKYQIHSHDTYRYYFCIQFFQCSIKQATAFIAVAFKMAKKLNNDVLKIAQYAKQYIEERLTYLPINMARWVSQI